MLLTANAGRCLLRSGDSPFGPLALSPSPTFWLKADAGTFLDTGLASPATADGAAVKGYLDQSGQGHNPTQGTSSKAPLLKLSIKNGLPVLRFDGVDDFLAVTAASAWATTGSFEFYAVLARRSTGASGNDLLVCDIGSGGHDGMYCAFSGGGQRFDFNSYDGTVRGLYDNAATNSFYSASTFIMVNGRYKAGTGWTIRKNGVDVVSNSNAQSAETFTQLTLGCLADGTRPGNIDLGECLFIPGDISAQRTLLETYLNRWGVM